MTLINNNVSGYWQQAGIYGAPQTSFTTNATASQAYKPNNTMPKMDMPSMLKIMLQMMKMLQGVQGPRYGQSQSTFNNAASPYPQMNPANYGKRFLSPSPVTPTNSSTESSIVLLALLIHQNKGSSILPNLLPKTPPTPSTPSTPETPPTPSTPETPDLPIYTPPPPNKKVYIVGSYDQKKWLKGEQKGASLGDTIQNFSGTDTEAGWGTSAAAWHDADKTNNDALKNLFSKMSDEDKKISFKDNEAAYVLDENGKILAKIGASQIVDKEALQGGAGVNVNSSFSIVEDLGVDKSNSLAQNNAKGLKNIGEAKGGKINLNGQEYDVITTVIRKDTPLTFDLNGDGVKTSNKMIQYDIDGDGTLDNINNVADGTLTIRGGASGKDLFGNNTDLDGDGKADGFKNGFDALKALSVQEGLIDGKKDMVLDASDLVLLQKKYQLAMKTAGYNSKNEYLADLGISEINLGETNDVQNAENFDGQGNDLMTQEGSTFKLNGKTQDYADVWHLLK